MEEKQCTGQFFFAGKLIDYTGPAAPEDFTLPEDMEIIPWEHPRFFWLKHKGTLVAGPAKREVLESFVHTRGLQGIEGQGNGVLEGKDQRQS